MKLLMFSDGVYMVLHVIRNLHGFVLVRSFALNDWMTCRETGREVETQSELRRFS